MEVISDDNHLEKIKLLKFKPSDLKIPTVIVKIITKNDLMNIENVNTRAKVFLRALYLRKLKSSTVQKYFNKLKPHLFPNTTIVPNSLVFDDNYNKTLQFRCNDINKIKHFINYVKYEIDNNCIYKWPILLSSYSGLRLNEVCNISMSHLYMLKKHKVVIPLKRKNNVDWEVIYYNEFNKVIKETIKYNNKKYKLFVEHSIDSKLFPYTSQALHEKIKHYYLLAIHEIAPIGFGLHSVRYYLATLIYNETSKIEIAQVLLGHKNQKTTERYIKQDDAKRRKELEQLSENVNLYKNIKDVMNHDDL